MPVRLYKTAKMLESNKEIMIERHGNTTQQLCIDTPLAEDLVHVSAIAIDFLRQPRCRAALATQLVADERTDVDLDATFFGRFE